LAQENRNPWAGVSQPPTQKPREEETLNWGERFWGAGRIRTIRKEGKGMALENSFPRGGDGKRGLVLM